MRFSLKINKFKEMKLFAQIQKSFSNYCWQIEKVKKETSKTSSEKYHNLLLIKPNWLKTSNNIPSC